MKIFTILLFVNSFCLVCFLKIFNITPFKETKITENIESNDMGYFKINLKDMKEEDKSNLYIQYKIEFLKTNQYFTVGASGFLEEPLKENQKDFV